MASARIRQLRERWDALQPSKTMLVWACAGSVAAALIVGFTWGGWVTGGTAHQMAASSGEQARSELASVICVENFLASPNASAQLAELKELSLSYRQRQFVENAGWATMPQMATANRAAADLCARVLASLEMNSVDSELETSPEPAAAAR